MDISWKKENKYNNELYNKKFFINNSPKKGNMMFNQNNLTNIDIQNNQKNIYSKKKGNSLFDSKNNNDNYQSYQILYLNNPNNNSYNSKAPKMNSEKIIHNYYQTNSNYRNKEEQIINNNNKMKLNIINRNKNNIKINSLNKKISNVYIDSNNNNINSKSKERPFIYDTASNFKNNENIFKTNNTNMYISKYSKENNKNKIYNNKKEQINIYENHQNNSAINHNNKIKNKSINYNPQKISKIISNSSSQQNLIVNNPKILVKTEENYDNNISGYINNLNNINILNRNNYAFYISPNRNNNNNINNLGQNNRNMPISNKSAKKEKIKYYYNNDNNINESDYINNNNYSNINIDLYGSNNYSKNNNNYINLYLMNNINNNDINNKTVYYQSNNQNIQKNNMTGNYYMTSENNFNSPKVPEKKEVLKNIRVNTTAMTRNNVLTERNRNDSKKNRNKSLEDSDNLINIKIKNNTNYINKIINKTNDNGNLYNINNKLNSTKIYRKKIESKNNKPLIYQKENNSNMNISSNKSPNKDKNKNINKKRGKLKNQKNNLNKKSNIILEKPKNKNSFKKKLYCYNIKIYEIKKCYFGKTYLTKNIIDKKNKNKLEESHEMYFTEKISVLIDNNNMNTLSINNTNQIDDPSLIENSFKINNKIPKNINSSNTIQSYNNSKINPKNTSENHPPIPNKNLIKSKQNFKKSSKNNNNYLNLLDNEQLEMTFGIEEIQNMNQTNELSTFNKKEEFDDEGDLYQNEDIQIMTDEEDENQDKDKDNIRITQGKEITNNTMTNPYKINKGLELLEKIQEKRKNSKLDLNLNIGINNDEDTLYNDYHKKTNTLKPKDTKMVLKKLTKNKKCEILNDVLTDLFEKKEKEANLLGQEILNYNPNKIEKYEKIFNQEQIQNLENILNKKKLDKMFDFIYDKEEIMQEIKSKKSIMTYNKKLYKNIYPEIIEESTINDYNTINNENKIIFSYKYILNLNTTNILCKKDNLLTNDVIQHCDDLLNNFEKEYKKGNIQNTNLISENTNNNTNIEKWSRKDMSIEIKKAEEYVKNMNEEMSKNNYKYEIIEILNTLTVDNYKEILYKLSNIVYLINDNKKIKPEILIDNQFRFCEIIIEKAIMEKGYVKLYAKICFDLYLVFNKLIDENPNNKLIDSENLQSLLISECKQRFNDYQYNNNIINNNLDNNNDISEENFLIKKKFLGNINFITELIDVKLFSQKIGFYFLDILYKNYKNYSNNLEEEKNKNLNLEGIITLLNKFGKIVFEEKNEKFLQDLDYYMKECIIPIINNKDGNIPEYLKYKIINLVEKQKNNWEESLFEKSILAKGKNKE